MPVKGTTTKSTPFTWDEFLKLSKCLKDDNEYSLYLLLNIGCHTGLLITQIRELKWVDLLYKDFFIFDDRKVIVSNTLRRIITDSYKGQVVNEFVMMNEKGSGVISSQYLNRKLKKMTRLYNIGEEKSNYTTHSMRKTFCLRILELGNNSLEIFLKLPEIISLDPRHSFQDYLGLKCSDKSLHDIYKTIK